MSTHRALQLVDELAYCGVKAVELTGGGEPTIHPAFTDVCNGLSNRGIQYGVVTNGSAWSSKVADSLLGAAWVRISIDCADSVTYAKTRKVSPDVYYRVRENIRALVHSKSNSDPVIGVGFVVTKDNWREVYRAALKAQYDGADNFRISAVFQNEGLAYFSEFYSSAQGLCHAAKQVQSEEFTVFDLFGERLEDLEQQSPSHSFCPIQHLVPYIGADLNVYRCCVLAYNNRGLLGSIANQTFGELWWSEQVANMLNDFDATDCPRCMFNKKNDTIRYALNPKPEHVNFL